MRNHNKVIFYTINRSTIKKFIILECVTGMSVYYTLKIITSSVLVGIVGSYTCTEIIKKVAYKS